MQSATKKSLFILFLVVATELIGFGLIIPILPQLALKFETNAVYLGLLMASYSIMQFFAAPYLGRLSDKLGRKPVLIVSKLGSVISYIILAYAQNYWFFLLARALDGFTGGNIAVARAYVIDVTSKKERSKGMAVIGIGFATGFILGPALGGMLYSDASEHQVAALVAGGLSLCACVLTILFLREPQQHNSSKIKINFSRLINALRDKYTCLVLATYMLYMIIFAGFETSFALFTLHTLGLSAANNSLIFMYTGILALLVQGTIMRYTSVRVNLMIIFGLSLVGISFMLYASVQGIIVLLAYLAVMVVGIGLINTYMPTAISLNTKANMQGYVMGIYESISSFSRIIGPIIAYTFITIYPRTGYFVFGVLLLLAVLVFIFFKPANTYVVETPVNK